ncbi:hypothetical protein TKK_0011869 [Trichogramma kaykai]|uniref:Uncharacterized protein n=1 Tax=Trichogramma kaykai TaxID=54128 RepID=A0ABD2WPI5_9HYME
MDEATKFLLAQQLENAELIPKIEINLRKAPKERQLVNIYRKKREQAEELWKEFKANHFILVAKEGLKKNEYFTAGVYEVTEDAYIDTLMYIDSKVPPAAQPRPAKVTPTPKTSEDIVQRIQLPRIELPTFNGDPILWEGFSLIKTYSA